MHRKLFRKGGAAILAASMALNAVVVTSPSVFVTAADETRFEFENATFTGDVSVVKNSNASGGYCLKMTDSGTINIDFEAESAGMHTLKIYAGGIGSSKQQNVLVNGNGQGSLAIPQNDTDFEVTSITANLNKGENTLTIEKSWGWTNFDYFTIEPFELPPITASQVTTCDYKATAETRSLMNYLSEVYGNNIISGQQEIYRYGHDGNLEVEFDYLKNLTGKLPAIRGFDFLNSANILYGEDDGTVDRMIEWATEKNGIVTAAWHITVPREMSGYKVGDYVSYENATYKPDETNFATENILVEGTVEREFYLKTLEEIAPQLQELQEAGVPVIWRPLHEAEGQGGEIGGWFWWASAGSAVYKDIWRLTYDTLVNEYNIHNLIWEWNSYNFNTSENWYPGDEYVDLIAYDKYSGNTGSAASVFYGIMEKYDSKKMVAMAENDSFSTVENLTADKAGWLYFCTWYDGGEGVNFLSDPKYNTEENTINMYQSDYCITLDELPADLYTRSTPVPTPPATTTTISKPITTTSTTVTDPDKNYGKVLNDSSTGNFKITLPEITDEFYITVELPSGVTYANGGLGVSIPLDGEYYWVNIQWEATKSGAIKVNVFDNFLNCSIGNDVIDDEALIEKVKAELGKTKTYEGQIWYAEKNGTALEDKSGIKILNVYTKKAGEPAVTTPPQTDGKGFYVDGQTIRDANGNAFEMRGVNIAHAWYKDKTEQSIKAAAELGTNCVRIVCADGAKWDKTTASELEDIIGWCIENKQVCILEVHDATGSNSNDDIIKAAEYWASMADILNANRRYVIVNIANEWYGDWNSSGWAAGCKQAIQVIRDAGIKNMIMIDCAGWGQYPASIKEEGASVFASDPEKNTVFSIHMYEYAGGTAQMVKNNIDGALECGAPVVVGEFGLKHSDGDVDEATVMSYCEENDMGYIAWSWMGNSGGVEYLDLVSSWDGSQLTEWGEIYFNAIKNNSEIASVFTQQSGPAVTVYGDANCDGKVLLNDAILIMQVIGNPDGYAVGGSEESAITAQGLLNADVSGNSDGLTNKDALAVQKYILKIGELPEV